MASQYASAWPPHQQHDQAYVRFIEDFYRISDTPDVHDQWVDQYTPDATLVLASKKARGHEGRLIHSGFYLYVTYFFPIQ